MCAQPTGNDKPKLTIGDKLVLRYFLGKLKRINKRLGRENQEKITSMRPKLEKSVLALTEFMTIEEPIGMEQELVIITQDNIRALRVDQLVKIHMEAEAFMREYHRL